MMFRAYRSTIIAVFLMSAATPSLPIAKAIDASITVRVEGIETDGRIAETFALCKATADGKSGPGANMRPDISWSAGPAGTKSYAILVIDPDVPADFTDAGKEGKILRNDAKRQPFFHWALVDIPASTSRIPGGESTIAPAIGKQVPADLAGYVSDPRNFGGPCPPWNDERVHHYHFIVMALDTETLALPEKATANDVFTAASGHSIARGEQVGTYTLNPLLRNRP
jgi:Raf kinase inhibitor-like YbhB/YbcL family protein